MRCHGAHTTAGAQRLVIEVVELAWNIMEHFGLASEEATSTAHSLYVWASRASPLEEQDCPVDLWLYQGNKAVLS